MRIIEPNEQEKERWKAQQKEAKNGLDDHKNNYNSENSNKDTNKQWMINLEKPGDDAVRRSRVIKRKK